MEVGDKVKFLHDNKNYEGIIIISQKEYTGKYAVSCLHPDFNKCGLDDKLGHHVGKHWGYPNSICLENISDYHNKWHKWFHGSELTPYSNSINHLNDGCSCTVCNQFHMMAAANQPDGTFKCFSCRNNPVRGYY